MLGNTDKIIFNKNFIIIYSINLIDIYEYNENSSTIKDNHILNLEINNIADIQFNPIKDNIILISYGNGICKIYDIFEAKLKAKLEEKIIFEGIKGKTEDSKFNELNTNIIATMCDFNNLIIWDVRESKYVNIIKNDDKILIFKWNKFSENLIEIITEKEYKLINANDNKIVNNFESNIEINNIIFLDRDKAIIIKDDKIEKVKNKNNIEILKLLEMKENIIDSNEDFIKNDIFIIFTNSKIKFIDILQFEIIKEIKYYFSNLYKFIDGNNENEILFYYYYRKRIQKDSIIINNNNKKILKLENYSDLNNINIENNFYKSYQKIISKYISLLNFDENIPEAITKKKYMNIQVIKEFFDKAKNINIFDRKDLINKVFDDNKKLSEPYEILNKNDFKNLKQIWNLKSNDRISFLEKVDKDDIINLYIEIIKLLTIDNINSKLIEIYLIFLKMYQKDLLKHFNENEIEIYNNEVKYYYPCFSPKDYKELFGLEKESEKAIVFNFLKKANEIEKFNYDNKELKNLVNKAGELIKDKPDFNQPIELDNNNKELIWHNIKINILDTFKDLELKKDNQNLLDRIKNGVHMVISKKLLNNDNILKNKDKLECALLLITNPCKTTVKTAEFCSNLLLSTKLTEKELKTFQLENKNSCELKEKENHKFSLIYDEYEFRDPEFLCLENIPNTNFKSNEKYNFDYLLRNSVKNQEKIKYFLKNILQKNVFKEVYKTLFGDEKCKFLNDIYLDEILNRRLKFAPIQPYGTAGYTDKISLNSYISANEKYIEYKSDIEFNNLEELLYTGGYILNAQHEIFNLFACIPYYENNCSISIKTPRKKNYDIKDKDIECGRFMEYLLYNTVFEKISLGQILYILNEANYNKILIDFKIGFEKLEEKDLIIEGIFKDYYLGNTENISINILNHTFINVKSFNIKIPTIELGFYRDVIGNK